MTTYIIKKWAIDEITFVNKKTGVIITVPTHRRKMDIIQHITTLFSSQAAKAWVAGLVTVLAAYLVPLISNWLAGLTPEALNAYFGGYGFELPYGVAAALIGALGVVWTYAVKNRR